MGGKEHGEGNGSTLNDVWKFGQNQAPNKNKMLKKSKLETIAGL